MLTAQDFELAKQCRGPKDSITPEVEAAVTKIAGEVESLCNVDGFERGDAIKAVADKYKGWDAYYSLVDRCVQYDRP